VILEILLVVDLFLWFLSLLPVPGMSQFNWATSWLAWIAVLLITLVIFMPGMRG
jgi:Flp pilus assembly protein protease CpaA